MLLTSNAGDKRAKNDEQNPEYYFLALICTRLPQHILDTAICMIWFKLKRQ